jgi:regulator of protease activity HflC (stomatin/prohibitin superfamily)
MMVMGALVGLGLYGLYLVSRCFFRVEEGHVATLTSFGAVQTHQDNTLRTWPSGLHTKAPWQHVIDVPMAEQSLDLTREEDSRMAMAEDGTVLRVDSILRFTPQPTDLKRYLFTTARPDSHMAGLFTCLLRNEVANFRGGDREEEGSYSIIRRGRHALHERIGTFCREQIGARYGVQFHAIDLVDILPPDEIAEALNAVIHAKKESEIAYFHAESECARRVLSAERGVEISSTRAAAVEQEIITLGDFLSTLHTNKTLQMYVARRRHEVTAESRAVYIKGKP